MVRKKLHLLHGVYKATWGGHICRLANYDDNGMFYGMCFFHPVDMAKLVQRMEDLSDRDIEIRNYDFCRAG